MQRASALDITHRDADMPIEGPADPAYRLIEFPLLRRQRRGFDRLVRLFDQRVACAVTHSRKPDGEQREQQDG